jgi:hypothetical protein
MKKKTTGWMLLACAMLTGIPFMTSCSTDDNIDVGEIDKTLGFGADDMNVPLGAAENIKLDDVLSLNEGDAIETLKKDSATYKSGDYQFKKWDNLDPSAVKVNEVHFDTFSPQAFSLNIPLALVQVLGFLDDKVYTFPTDGPQKINAFDVTGAGNDDVVALEEADLEGSFKFNLGLSSLKNEVQFTQIDLYIPEFLELDLDYIKKHHSFITGGLDLKQAGEARDGRSGSELTEDEKNFNVLTLNSVATTNEAPLELKLKRVKGIQKKAPTKTADIEKGYIVFSKSEGLKLHGVIKMQLNFKKGQLFNKETFSSTETRTLNPEISMPTGINITHAEGIFDPKININPSTVNIGNDVPDFLNDEKVSIQLNNPTIKLSVKSNINATANIKPKIVAYFDDAKTDYKYMYIRGKDKNNNDVWPKISANKTGDDNQFMNSYIVINRLGMTMSEAQALLKQLGNADLSVIKMDGSFPKINTNDKKEVTNISELLSPRIPKSIDFEIEAQVDQNTTAKVDLFDANDPNTKGDKYIITPSYEFIAPLALDPGSQIVYNDTIADWNDDIKDKDIELYKDGEIIVTANVHNNTPLQLHMDPVPIGLDKKKINDIQVTSDIVVESNLDKSEDTVTPIEIKLTGSIKNLDGLAFKVTARSQNTATLNKDTQYINVTDIKLNLKGRIAVSL